jgi:hypothetical protein
MAIIKDIIDGNSATYSSGGWKDLNRRYVVTALSSVSGHGRIYEAMLAVNQNMATESGISLTNCIGYPHPTITSAQSISVSPDAISPDIVNVTVSYDEVENYPYQYSLGANSSIVETNQALNPANGKYEDIVMTYTFPDDYPIESFRSITKKSGITINKYEPEFAFTIKRREFATIAADSPKYAVGSPLSGAALMDRNWNFVGKCNMSTWNIFGRQITPRTFICTGINSDGVSPYSSNGGWIFDVSYSFSGKDVVDVGLPNVKCAWDSLVCFVDPNTGTPPDPATLVWGQSKKVLQMYKEVDFNLLGLS